MAQLQWLLIASLLGAVSALLLVTGWLLTDPASTRVDAPKTGGLAGGAVLARYALWINDRRRRTEEARQEVERVRVEQEGRRMAGPGRDGSGRRSRQRERASGIAVSSSRTQ